MTGISCSLRLECLPSCGPKLAHSLEGLGLYTVADFLAHLPLRYEDRTRVAEIGTVSPRQIVQVVGEVLHSEVVGQRRRMLVVSLSDGTGYLRLRFFRFYPRQKDQFKRGTKLRCFGEVREVAGVLEMAHPQYERLHSMEAMALPEHLTPVYPVGKGVKQKDMRMVAESIRKQLVADKLELYRLPAVLAARPDLKSALLDLHFPRSAHHTDDQPAHDASRRRLARDELLAHHLAIRLQREQRLEESGEPVSSGHAHSELLRSKLPFSLTSAQVRAIEEIGGDLGRNVPMRRLLQGDVGSGKTVVAALAAAWVVGSGYQVALMVPTELLAEQHHRTLSPWLAWLQIPVLLLSGSSSNEEKREAISRMASGEALVVVGTHALFQSTIPLPRLVLAIIDEQHRFGVGQRLALNEKSELGTPHQLIMTATPIPRTLAMTVYADLDVSILDESPPGRQPVKTVVVPESRRDEVIDRVRQILSSGQQAYWVCPLINESDALDAQSAETVAKELGRRLSGIATGLIHGRIKPEQKEDTMRRFLRRDIQLLVATTVIEVGVDVPGATLMVIENAERLGLAQLHQLRGRVGRGATASHCVLIYRSPLSAMARARLRAIRESTDGFTLAQRDLELRGPGEVLGTKQSGALNLKVADLGLDRDLLADIPALAGKILQRDMDAAQALIGFWTQSGERYVKV